MLKNVQKQVHLFYWHDMIKEKESGAENGKYIKKTRHKLTYT